MGRDASARMAFRQKVEFLEALVSDSRSTADLPLISSINDLRIWTGESHGQCFGTWKSFSVAVPNGRNGDLRLRFDQIRPYLKARQKDAIQTDPLTKRSPNGTGPHRHTRADFEDLLRQNHALIIEKFRLLRELLMERDTNAALREENARLMKAIRKRSSY